MTLAIRLACCPLCGRPLSLQTAAGTKDYIPRERLSIRIGRYLGGSSKGERFIFGGEVCRKPCAADLERLIAPLIEYIHERDIGR